MLVLFRNPTRWNAQSTRRCSSAVDELLRYAGLVYTTRRVAKMDVSSPALTSSAVRSIGSAAANRDPDKYTDPDKLDVARNPTDHLAFGDGIHFCLGASLARLEGQIAIGTLWKRYPDLRLLDEEPEWAGTFAIRGVTRLRVAP
jgi:cytochrome P450